MRTTKHTNNKTKTWTKESDLEIRVVAAGDVIARERHVHVVESAQVRDADGKVDFRAQELDEVLERQLGAGDAARQRMAQKQLGVRLWHAAHVLLGLQKFDEAFERHARQVLRVLAVERLELGAVGQLFAQQDELFEAEVLFVGYILFRFLDEFFKNLEQILMFLKLCLVSYVFGGILDFYDFFID